MASALNHCSVGAAYMPPATDRGLSSTGSHPPTSRTLPACFAATSPEGRLSSRAPPAQKGAPFRGDSPLRGEMSRSDRGARARRAGRVSGLGDSDGPCLIARYTHRRPGIPPPRLRSAPPFDKGGFLRGASETPPTFLVKKLTAQILRFSACKSVPYVVQYKLTNYGKNRRNSKWNTAIRS